MSRRILAALLAVPLLLIGLLLANTARQGSRQLEVDPLPVEVDGEAVAEILSEAVQIPTISRGRGEWDLEALGAFHELIRQRFPRVHEALEVRTIAEHSLLFRWPGSDPSLAPGLLLSHIDVVPAEAPGSWTRPPFAGQIADGAVWGRGTLDDKQNTIEQLWAVQALLDEGFAPRRTMYLAMGHDEEAGGTGAAAIAAALQREGVRLAFVVDEGGAVVSGVLEGVDAPVALVGIAEKGYASVQIVAASLGGHSSMPPPTTAAGRVAAAVARLEASPLPARLQGPTALMMDYLGPEGDAKTRLFMTNRWLFRPVLTSIMASKPKTNATIRTTTAVTMLEGSVKDNVLPQQARAVVNFRIAPGDTVESVLRHVRDTVEDPELEVALFEGSLPSEPSPVSPAAGEPWDLLSTAIRQTWGDALVAPYLMLGAADARHFTGLSEHVYRFSPMRVEGGDLDTIHGRDEHVSVRNLADGAAFYVRLLKAAGGAP